MQYLKIGPYATYLKAESALTGDTCIRAQMQQCINEAEMFGHCLYQQRARSE